MKHDVAFLGLGVMGGPMAMHLTRAGHRVTVYNRTRHKAEALKAEALKIPPPTQRSRSQTRQRKPRVTVTSW